MANKQIIFSDRIVGLSVQNGLVRIDLAAITGPAKTKDGKDGIKLEITHQLVMPLDGFAEGLSAQQKLMQGLIARQQQGRVPAAAEGTDASANQAAAPSA